MTTSPEGMHRTYDIISDSGTYVYSDGQQPPSYVSIWYETHPDHAAAGYAVALCADGLYTEEQISLFSADDQGSVDLAITSIIETGSMKAASITQLNTDPRNISPEAAEAAAQAAARCLFAVATAQQQ